MKKIFLLVVALLYLNEIQGQIPEEESRLKFAKIQELYSSGEYLNCIMLCDELAKQMNRNTAQVGYLRILALQRADMARQLTASFLAYNKRLAEIDSFISHIDVQKYPEEKYRDILQAKLHFENRRKSYTHQKHWTPEIIVNELNIMANSSEMEKPYWVKHIEYRLNDSKLRIVVYFSYYDPNKMGIYIVEVDLAKTYIIKDANVDVEYIASKVTGRNYKAQRTDVILGSNLDPNRAKDCYSNITERMYSTKRKKRQIFTKDDEIKLPELTQTALCDGYYLFSFSDNRWREIEDSSYRGYSRSSYMPKKFVTIDSEYNLNIITYFEFLTQYFGGSITK